MSRFLLTTLLCAVSLPALAADIPGRRSAQPVYKSQAAPLPAFAWTGFYLGLNGGANWGDFTKGGKFIDAKTGFTGGLTAGYNQQFGNFVAGIEGDYNYTGMSGRGLLPPLLAFNVKDRMTSFGTARVRLGMSFDRALIYATGGYGFGFTTLSNGINKSSNTHHGYVVGAGLEYAFTNNVSAKAEYLYMPFGTGNVVPAASNLLTAPNKAGVNSSVLRAGVNYRF